MRESAIDEAVRLLTKRRNEALAEVSQIENALADLGHPVSDRSVGPSAEPVGQPPVTTNGTVPKPSVRVKALALLNEGDRDWSTGEVIAEYERRGLPFTVKNVDDALRAALVEATRKGHVVRTKLGRYKSAAFEADEAGRRRREQVAL